MMFFVFINTWLTYQRVLVSNLARSGIDFGWWKIFEHTFLHLIQVKKKDYLLREILSNNLSFAIFLKLFVFQFQVYL